MLWRPRRLADCLKVRSIADRAAGLAGAAQRVNASLSSLAARPKSRGLVAIVIVAAQQLLGMMKRIDARFATVEMWRWDPLSSAVFAFAGGPPSFCQRMM